jgi:hypothetical protein
MRAAGHALIERKADEKNKTDMLALWSRVPNVVVGHILGHLSVREAAITLVVDKRTYRGVLVDAPQLHLADRTWAADLSILTRIIQKRQATLQHLVLDNIIDLVPSATWKECKGIRSIDVTHTFKAHAVGDRVNNLLAQAAELEAVFLFLPMDPLPLSHLLPLLRSPSLTALGLSIPHTAGVEQLAQHLETNEQKLDWLEVHDISSKPSSLAAWTSAWRKMWTHCPRLRVLRMSDRSRFQDGTYSISTMLEELLNTTKAGSTLCDLQLTGGDANLDDSDWPAQQLARTISGFRNLTTLNLTDIRIRVDDVLTALGEHTALRSLCVHAWYGQTSLLKILHSHLLQLEELRIVKFRNVYDQVGRAEDWVQLMARRVQPETKTVTLKRLECEIYLKKGPELEQLANARLPCVALQIHLPRQTMTWNQNMHFFQTQRQTLESLTIANAPFGPPWTSLLPPTLRRLRVPSFTSGWTPTKMIALARACPSLESLSSFEYDTDLPIAGLIDWLASLPKLHCIENIWHDNTATEAQRTLLKNQLDAIAASGRLLDWNKAYFRGVSSQAPLPLDSRIVWVGSRWLEAGAAAGSSGAVP